MFGKTIVKYQIGELVWCMNKNVPVMGVVKSYTRKQDTIRYTIDAENCTGSRCAQRLQHHVGKTNLELQNLMFPP